MNKYLFLTIVISFIVGCSSNPPKESADTENIQKKLRAEAEMGYLYSQMAENTYKPHSTFSLPKNIMNTLNKDNDGYGFAYSTFNRYKGSELVEIVLSFRGTDQFWDWPIGNVLALQNNRGLAVYRELRDATPNDIPITVIGHSLGGAIALHVSLREENVQTFVFNTSSRFTRGNAAENDRHSYSEYAEANKILRTFAIDPKWVHSIYSCTYGNPLTNHSQAKLSACLTACAAQELPEARQSVQNNPKIFGAGEIFDLACMEEA
ncbi:hypothetical protein GP2143_01560 [marine gamma proteobacterium HTCC2143]|uniref:Fungal lipase-like domain-containing protein n=1 Tax=marine gamma proteobacterium HTCC2143 TaxID=247633 RepID=A0YFT9_9GAMM|nr:hypothetical protein GP2143_01560 [marine gamma proteobacterium HTCC2143]